MDDDKFLVAAGEGGAERAVASELRLKVGRFHDHHPDEL